MPKYMSMIFFYFLKIIFVISISKRSKKYKLHLILTKINLKFDKTQLQTQYQTISPSRLCIKGKKKKITTEMINVEFKFSRYLPPNKKKIS